VRNNVFCEPGKLSDYVNAGIPVVAPNFPTIEPVIKQFNIGSTFDKLEARTIAQSIDEVLRISKDKWKEPLSEAAEKLVWDTQLPNLLGAIEGGIADTVI
jgi:hypothetical protein